MLGLERGRAMEMENERERERISRKKYNEFIRFDHRVNNTGEGIPMITSVSKARGVTETRLLDRVCKSINSSADRTNKSECN